MKTLCTFLFSLIYPMVFAVFSSAAGTETPPDTLVLQFKPGWSIFSAHVMPDSADMTFIFQPLINSGKLIKIQDENGNALEDYGFLGGWINNIGNFQQGKGYKIKVNAASTLSFTGQLTVLPFRIPLKAGWNLMGFPLQVTEDAKANVIEVNFPEFSQAFSLNRSFVRPKSRGVAPGYVLAAFQSEIKHPLSVSVIELSYPSFATKCCWNYKFS